MTSIHRNGIIAEKNRKAKAAEANSKTVLLILPFLFSLFCGRGGEVLGATRQKERDCTSLCWPFGNPAACPLCSQALRFCAPASRRVCPSRGTGVRAHAGL